MKETTAFERFFEGPEVGIGEGRRVRERGCSRPKKRKNGGRKKKRVSFDGFDFLLRPSSSPFPTRNVLPSTHQNVLIYPPKLLNRIPLPKFDLNKLRLQQQQLFRFLLLLQPRRVCSGGCFDSCSS